MFSFNHRVIHLKLSKLRHAHTYKMSDIITPEFKAHFGGWFEAFNPSRDREEVVREYEELWESYPRRIWLGFDTELELKRSIDKLLGFEIDEDTQLIAAFDAVIPEPGNFFTYIQKSPGCCYPEEEKVDYLVLSRGLFTCKVMSTPELEKDFALGFLQRFGEEKMVKKYLDAFEGASPIMRKFLDECILRSYMDNRDKDLPPEWSGAGDIIKEYPHTTSGWSGVFPRELYYGDVGTLHPCEDRAGVFYLVRRAGVFTCSIEFFEDKAAGEAAASEMTRRKTSYTEAKRLECEEQERHNAEVRRSYTNPDGSIDYFKYDAIIRENMARQERVCGGAGCASP